MKKDVNTKCKHIQKTHDEEITKNLKVIYQRKGNMQVFLLPSPKLTWLYPVWTVSGDVTNVTVVY